MSSAAIVREAGSRADRDASWKIREAVFIREQGVAEAIERDGLDDVAVHLVAVEGDATVVGTARLVALDGDHLPVPFDRARSVKIGRMAVLAERRGRGIGRMLLDAALDRVAALGLCHVELSAQEHAVPFYEHGGFRIEGEPYVEAGIPHRWMTLEILARDEAVALFERRRAAWLAQDLDAYLALWSDDMTFQSPVHAEPLRGKAAFADLIRHSFSFSRPLSFEFHRIAVHGATVLAEWTIAVERRDGGTRMQWRGMSVCEIHGGLIRSWREFWNPADLA